MEEDARSPRRSNRQLGSRASEHPRLPRSQTNRITRTRESTEPHLRCRPGNSDTLPKEAKFLCVDVFRSTCYPIKQKKNKENGRRKRKIFKIQE